MISVDPLSANDTAGHPVSPVSDRPIQTGAHSLSSTGSDMAVAINAVNREHLDSPPDLISPVAAGKQVIQLFPNNEPKTSYEGANNIRNTKNEELADVMTDYLLTQLLQEFESDLDAIVPRREIAMRSRQGSIKFFEKKGVKTDLFAIEKYVDEVLEEVKLTRSEFMAEIERPLTKNASAVLFQM